MKKLLLNIPENFVSATGWTLVHSLWQTLIIVLLFATFRYIFRQSSTTKYWLGIAALALQLTASVLTFTLVYEPMSNESKASSTTQFFTQNTAVQTIFTQATNAPLPELSWWEQCQLFLTGNLDTFVNLWCIGIFLLTFRLIGGYFYTQQLKWKQTKFADKNLQNIFEKLLSKIHLSKPIYLLESSLAKVPMTIGHFESVILFPVGLATGLSIKELEAILAHELAHIKRHDYLVNIVQSVIEILFFYHPAIWWISSKIREERENCCDDLAMQIVGNKIHLAKALTHVEMFRQQSNLAMAFGGNKQSLLSRVQRILGINRSQSTSYEGIISTLLIVIGSIIYVNLQSADAQTSQPKPKKTPQKVAKTIQAPTPPQADEIYEHSGNGIHYYTDGGHSVNIAHGQIIVDGKIVKLSPADSAKMVYHEAEIKKLEEKMKPYHEKINAITEQMNVYTERINKQNEPMNAHSAEMSKLGQEIGKLAKREAYLGVEMDKYSENSAKYKELEKQQEQIQSQMENLNHQMEGFDKQMEAFDEKMEKMSAPIDSLGKIIEQYEKPMEDIGNEIEEHGEAIEELIPPSVKQIINKGRHGRRMGYYVPPTPPIHPMVAPRVYAIAPVPPLPMNLETPLAVIAPMPSVHFNVKVPMAPLAPMVAVTPSIDFDVAPSIDFDKVYDEESSHKITHTSISEMSNNGILNATYKIVCDDKTYEIEEKDSKIVSLKIDNREIATKEISGYKSEVEEIIRAAKSQGKQIRTKLYKNKEGEAMRSSYRYSKPALAYAKQAEQYNKTRLAIHDAEKASMALQSKQSQLGLKALQFSADAAHERGEFRNQLQMLKNIIRDLIKENIIQDTGDLVSMGLTDKELVVNGRKITANIYQKFKEKYIKNSDIGIYYGPVNMTGKGIFFDKSDLEKDEK